jgi:phage terminase small subunit
VCWLKKEPDMEESAMNTRQTRFVEEFMVDGNATAAAIRAGYATRSARQTASRLMTKGDVQVEIARLAQGRTERVKFTADRVLSEAANLATQSMVAFVDTDGYLVTNMKDLPTDVVACVQEVTQDTFTNKEGFTITRVKLKLYDRLRALALVGKHVGVRAFAETVAPMQDQQSKGLGERLDEICRKQEMRTAAALERGESVCPGCEGTYMGRTRRELDASTARQ